MSRPYDDITERLLKLKPGASCMVRKPKVYFTTLHKYAPGSEWRSEARDGGRLVTRIR